ncbi:MAG: hypothetical protein ACE5PO_06235 [Candidatus Bathyarchaeia archaeon]
MKLRRDQRGFVLSGIALLLVLPAMLLATSFLGVIEAGGEAASLQALSDKVSSVGRDIERMVRYMENNKLTIDNSTLNALAENYHAATGLLVNIWMEDNRVFENVEDPRAAVRYFENIALT